MNEQSNHWSTSRLASTSRLWSWLAFGALGAVLVAGVVIDLGTTTAGGTQTADIGSQGSEADPVSIAGGSLERAADGVRVRTEMPTPTPGSYGYPTPDMVPLGAPKHPELLVGGPEEPETFTLWVIIFNHPDLCTDECNDDDLEPDAEAKGGVYQGDGRIADTDRLILEGAIRVGQEPSRGSPLGNPLGAEVHLAIAPHGKALEGQDLWRQLNGPIGNPWFWWLAAFPAP